MDMSDIEELVAQFPGAASYAVELTATDAYGNLKREAPVKTGTLRDSFDGPNKKDDFSYSIDIGVDYWRFINDGTAIHWIEPSGKALYFYFEKIGQWVFFKAVLHPGTRPNPFVDRALEATGGRVEEFVEMALDRIGAN